MYVWIKYVYIQRQLKICIFVATLYALKEHKSQLKHDIIFGILVKNICFSVWYYNLYNKYQRCVRATLLAQNIHKINAYFSSKTPKKVLNLLWIK